MIRSSLGETEKPGLTSLRAEMAPVVKLDSGVHGNKVSGSERTDLHAEQSRLVSIHMRMLV